MKTLVDARLLLQKKQQNNNNKINEGNNSGDNRGKEIGELSGGDRPLSADNVGTESNNSFESSSSSFGISGSSNNSFSNNGINMNHGPDIKTMGVSEIKRELKLYGITTDSFLEKRDLEVTLIRERGLRMPPVPPVGVVGNSYGGENKVHVIPGVGNVSPNASAKAVATQLNMSTSSSDNQSSSQQQQQQQQQQQVAPPQYIYDEQQSPNDRAALRELQISYEFERIQQTLPSASDIQYELETKFNISTKYFAGLKEMGYALAVARVDNMIERQLLGLEADGCVIDKNGNPIPQREGANPNCPSFEDDLLPSADELISMEYDNLYSSSWDEQSLAGELESQYGIPAKHFKGKKEMAYALAVERVSKAIEEGGLIMDDYMDEEDDTYGVMTDEDMMKMMEEEMMELGEQSSFGIESVSNYDQQQLRSQSSSGSKTFTKEEPNPFKSSGPSYQSTPLADMLKNDTKNRRRPQPKRTPISAEPPHSFRGSQRPQQNGNGPVQMGSVIGGDQSTYTNNKALADILKGSEQQRRQSSKSRTRATSTNVRSQKKMQFKTASARVDDSFRSASPSANRRKGNTYGNTKDRGYKAAWGKRASSSYNNAPPPISSDRGPGYTSSWNNKGPSQYTSGSTAKSSDRASRANGTQRPFEPAPFTQPGTHNAQGSTREPKRVPPQTPFNSPVTDGARGGRTSSGFGGGSQGPFTPFTTPGKRNTNGKPPPKKRSKDPRGFNIKDTPDDTQPFMGSQAFFDQYTSYSPPLHVDPPPRDPNYVPPERPFEPAPFSSPQPHAVRTDRFAQRPPRDDWNRVNPSSSPPPKSNTNQQRKERKNQKKQRVGSSSAFNNLKDMFSNIGGNKDNEPRKVEVEVGERGFKSGNVEVFSSNDNDDWPPKDISQRQDAKFQQALEVEIINAEMETDDNYWQEDEIEIDDPPPQPSSTEQFTSAWMGGPKTSPASRSPLFTTANGSDNSETVANTTPHHAYDTIIDDDAIMERAQHLISTNAGIRAIVTHAKSNPKIQEAVQKCKDNPAAFGSYLNDMDIGPILNDLRELVVR